MYNTCGCTAIDILVKIFMPLGHLGISICLPIIPLRLQTKCNI